MLLIFRNDLMKSSQSNRIYMKMESEESERLGKSGMGKCGMGKWGCKMNEEWGKENVRLVEWREKRNEGKILSDMKQHIPQ